MKTSKQMVLRSYHCLSRLRRLFSTRRDIAVAISGGVDSAVAALMLKRDGWNVTGIYMSNWDFDDEVGEEQCPYHEDKKDALEIAQKLDIPLKEISFSKEYWNEVFTPFLDAYQSVTSTPNPDVFCNRHIKFKHLLNYVRNELHIDTLATGHYARVSYNQEKDDIQLLCAIDPIKDQTYFLSLTQGNVFRHVIFPVGNFQKSKVKAIAEENFQGLRVLTKKESMGICFIGKRPMKEFLHNYLPQRNGNFIDIDTNEVVGQHQGGAYLTIGQKARISGQEAKYYVVHKSISQSSYGTEQVDIFVAKGINHPALFTTRLVIPSSGFNWLTADEQIPSCFNSQDLPITLTCRLRHGQPFQSCIVQRTQDGQLEVQFATPQRAVVPGQVLVLYCAERLRCLGGVVIPSSAITPLL